MSREVMSGWTREQLYKRIELLEDRYTQLMDVASYFCTPMTCKTCGRLYPSGYVCQCGRDNSVPEGNEAP